MMVSVCFDVFSNGAVRGVHALHSHIVVVWPINIIRFAPCGKLLVPIRTSCRVRHFFAVVKLISRDVNVNVANHEPRVTSGPVVALNNFSWVKAELLQPSCEQKGTVTASQTGKRLHAFWEVCGECGFNCRSKLCGKRLKACEFVVGGHFNVSVGECGYAIGICSDRCVARHSRWDALMVARLVPEAGVLAWLVLNGITPASPSPSVRNSSRTLP